MDYRTFLTSAYLAQGRADEFTRASVADRKKVLADILDLSRYERLEQMAKERRAEAEAKELDAEREVRAIDAELANEDGYALALERAQAAHAALAGEIDGLQQEYERRLAEVERMEAQEERARDYESRIPLIEDEIAQNARALADLDARIAAAEQIRDRRAEIEAAHRTFVALNERIRPLEAQFGQVLELDREARRLEAVIQAEREKLGNEHYRLGCDVDNLEKEARDLGQYDAEVERLEREIARYGDPQEGADPEGRRQRAEAGRAAADDAFVKLKAAHESVKTQIERLQKRVDALEASDEPLCEYCGQTLSPAQRRKAADEAQAEQAALRAQLKDLAARGLEAKKQGERHRQAAEQAQADLRSVARLDAQRAQAAQEQLRLAERTKALPDLRRRLDQFARRLQERDFAVEAQERLVRVSAQREKMERAVEELEAVRAERDRYQNAERDLLQLQHADQILDTEPARAEEIRGLIAKREAQIEKARKAIVDLRAKTAALPSLRREQGEASAGLAQAQARLQTAQREIGQYTAALAKCASLKEERVRRVEERQAAARDKDIYKELAGAFGKKGVQALIIENALPEIQDNANEILGRMTSGAMQVQLLTQREAKTKTVSGGAIETLDIIISDDMGTRPYEMYSGGEAFRVNFALRVALSRMLARRAGAPLQTLILDEGFGTQDPRGRESIADAIHSVADDFALILVITHIEELKEAFPTRIEVVKGPAGSTFTVA
jgi:exonuclease SbcC